MKPKNRIYILDDEDLVVTMLGRSLRADGYDVLGDSSPEDAVERIRAFSPDIVLLDIKLPGKSGIDILEEVVGSGIGTQVVMLSSDDTAGTAVRAMKLGAKDYLTKPFDLEKVKIVVRGLIEKMDLRNEVEYLRKVSEEFTRREIIGKSGAMLKLRTKSEKLARANVPTLLVTGESGTGKEMFARHIHSMIREASSDRVAPFVGINCAALPEPLVESELFGHEKGAFTDAKGEKRGVFEMAAGGSILLDEIGEMKPPLQAKLLRVLEERIMRRIGGKHDIPVDATVFATTNRDLADAVGRGDFRIDLFHRLNAFTIHIPPLRERKEDVPLLVRHFLSSYGERYKKMAMRDVSPRAEKLLMEYPWPGNVRELRNVVERIVVLESGDTILPEHLPMEITSRGEPARRAAGGITIPEKGLSLEELERDLIAQALEKTGGNKTAAAKLLNISYDSLRYQVKRLGLE